MADKNLARVVCGTGRRWTLHIEERIPWVHSISSSMPFFNTSIRRQGSWRSRTRCKARRSSRSWEFELGTEVLVPLPTSATKLQDCAEGGMSELRSWHEWQVKAEASTSCQSSSGMAHPEQDVHSLGGWPFWLWLSMSLRQWSWEDCQKPNL